MQKKTRSTHCDLFILKFKSANGYSLTMKIMVLCHIEIPKIGSMH